MHPIDKIWLNFETGTLFSYNSLGHLARWFRVLLCCYDAVTPQSFAEVYLCTSLSGPIYGSDFGADERGSSPRALGQDLMPESAPQEVLRSRGH